MKYFRKIEGEKVYLSPMNVDDYEMYTKWLNDFVVTDGIKLSAKLTTLESERQWLREATEKNEYVFAIVDKETNKLLGNCGLNTIEGRNACVGIFLGEKRNKGYGTDALKTLVKYGFDYLNLKNISLSVYSFNEIAQRCYEKVGFKKCGVQHNVYYLKNKYYDKITMEILREDYYLEKK